MGTSILDSPFASCFMTGTSPGGARAGAGTGGFVEVVGSAGEGDLGGALERAAVAAIVGAADFGDAAGATATLIGRRVPLATAVREIRPHDGCQAALRRMWIAARCNVPNKPSDGSSPAFAASFSCR